jgi:Ca2+-binding EF-hand superfamily protein
MKSVAASLYNFLDHDQNGRVSFNELLLKIYPNLSALHIRTIDGWTEDYNLNFNLSSNLKPARRQDDTKKRVLPKACLPRFQEMFAFYDRTRKGYIDLDDMRKVLAEVCSEKEILELFEDSDRDGDGRLSLLEFANVILPMDLEIEGLQ